MRLSTFAPTAVTRILFTLMGAAFLWTGCRTRTFGEGSASGRSGSSSALRGVVNDTTGGCVHPTAADFESQQTTPADRGAMRSALFHFPNGFFTKAPYQVLAQSREEWLRRTVVPLNMNCDTYKSKGILKYGDDAWNGFVSTYALAASGSDELALRKHAIFSFGKFDSVSRYPMLNILRGLNKRISGTKEGGELRDGKTGIFHSIPLTEKELLAFDKIRREGVIEVFERKEPFANAYGEMVSGKFIQYPEGPLLEALVEKFESEAQGVLKRADVRSTILGAGRLMRRCVSIHPFHDGNGRTCTLFAVYLLAKHGIPHSVIWAGEDVLLTEPEWISRFERGVSDHQALLAGFSAAQPEQ